MSLGSRLKKARQRKGWSQTYVCQKLDIGNSTLSGYERDYREPDTTTIKQLADLYEVSTDYLLGNDLPPEQRANEMNKDERDIAKRMDELRKDLANPDGLSFSGEPMSEEAIESLLEAMEYAFKQTQRINKKYIPKKYREDD